MVKKILLSIGGTLLGLGVLLLLGLGALTLLKSPEVRVGSVSSGNTYHVTSTINMSAGGINIPAHDLGSIIITSSTSVGQLIVSDASIDTSTATTTIATFKAAAVEGTYTFDVALLRGLNIQIPTGFNGAFTVTFR